MTVIWVAFFFLFHTRHFLLHYCWRQKWIFAIQWQPISHFAFSQHFLIMITFCSKSPLLEWPSTIPVIKSPLHFYSTQKYLFFKHRVLMDSIMCKDWYLFVILRDAFGLGVFTLCQGTLLDSTLSYISDRLFDKTKQLGKRDRV